ncbi:BPL1 [Candida margitis]|uniref:BPL1 n=1 Tax=Candida margitis TaxID=1775924 RepID=UPI002227BC77|nr:BPL1 [Candida margitis]KAI5969261.1 BPL1 [Candida margitis]
MNVLVYSGPGTTTESVKHCIDSLRIHLSKFYAVLPVNETVLLAEPWMRKTSMLVIPGGDDLSYCRVLNGAGNRKIKRYVKDGGKFMGFGAGGYFSSARCEFNVGSPLEVSGTRELAFYPGTCKGEVFSRCNKRSHGGAKATKLSVNIRELPNAPEMILSYLNGGSIFMDSSRYRDVKVLARYVGQMGIEDEINAAIIYRKIGKGVIILCGPRPEFSPRSSNKTKGEEGGQVVSKLKADDRNGRVLLREMLRKLGLRVCEDVEDSTPSTTPMYFTSPFPRKIQTLWSNLSHNLEMEKGLFRDNYDTFKFQEVTSQNELEFRDCSIGKNEDSINQAKIISFMTSGQTPTAKLTPYFDMQKYFDSLFRLSTNAVRELGTVLGYSEVVSSTHTLLEQNLQWLKYLPHGLTITASTQVSGRGRGGNIWLNPRGVLPATILLKVPQKEVGPSFIVTLQYVCGLALIEAILGYGSRVNGDGAGYEDMPMRIKWPNDIYMLKPEYFNNRHLDSGSTLNGKEEKYVKVAGSLLSSHCIDSQFYLIWGGGVNVSNDAPTTSLNVVLTRLNELRKENNLPALPQYGLEALLAKIVATIDHFYATFKKSGLSPFLPLYYRRWLHSNQTVAVSGHQGGSRTCIIKGISPEFGLLIAQDVSNQEILHLQPDGNSFDLFKGLVYKKNT